MSDKETKDIKPNEKEMRLFEQEKMDLYKGTFVVCIVYGLSAFILLVIILFTDWGKIYIYDMFAPAVITYILGALIIIIYLLNEIFSLKPRKIGADIDSDNNILCPDFWKLEKVPTDMRDEIINNNVFNTNNYIIPEITREANANLRYRCIPDANVFGATPEYYKMKNDYGNFGTGFMYSSNAITNSEEISKSIKSIKPPDYIISSSLDKSANNYKDLKTYAKFTGAYSTNNSNIFQPSNISLKPADTSKSFIALKDDATTWKKYEDDSPLICNVVYPQVLGLLDSNTKEKNEVSCEYAKQCGISWSSLKCA